MRSSLNIVNNRYGTGVHHDEIPFPYKTDSIYFQYHVSDFDRAKKFNEEVMGLEKVWDGGSEVGWAEFELPVKGARLGINLREGEIKKDSGL